MGNLNGEPQYGAPPYGEPQCVSSGYHPNVSARWGIPMGNPNMGHLNGAPQYGELPWGASMGNPNMGHTDMGHLRGEP